VVVIAWVSSGRVPAIAHPRALAVAPASLVGSPLLVLAKHGKHHGWKGKWARYGLRWPYPPFISPYAVTPPAYSVPEAGFPQAALPSPRIPSAPPAAMPTTPPAPAASTPSAATLSAPPAKVPSTSPDATASAPSGAMPLTSRNAGPLTPLSPLTARSPQRSSGSSRVATQPSIQWVEPDRPAR
jgi:hypothetical protein